jgi:hypothetical protein
MFSKFVEKFTQLKDHHQILFGFMAFLALTIFSWSIEKICEEILVKSKNKKLIYLLIVIFSILILSFTNFFVKNL